MAKVTAHFVIVFFQLERIFLYSWGPCTRTCGGGIRSSRRYCDSPPPANGGPFCTGSKIRYESCNTQPCSPDAVDFREIQCAEFNGDSKGLQGLPSDVKWVPKYGISSK